MGAQQHPGDVRTEVARTLGNYTTFAEAAPQHVDLLREHLGSQR